MGEALRRRRIQLKATPPPPGGQAGQSQEEINAALLRPGKQQYPTWEWEEGLKLLLRRAPPDPTKPPPKSWKPTREADFVRRMGLVRAKDESVEGADKANSKGATGSPLALTAPTGWGSLSPGSAPLERLPESSLEHTRSTLAAYQRATSALTGQRSSFAGALELPPPRSSMRRASAGADLRAQRSSVGRLGAESQRSSGGGCAPLHPCRCAPLAQPQAGRPAAPQPSPGAPHDPLHPQVGARAHIHGVGPHA